MLSGALASTVGFDLGIFSMDGPCFQILTDSLPGQNILFIV